MQTPKLKGCPLCGGGAKLRTYRTYSPAKHCMVEKYYVECEECGLDLPCSMARESAEETVENWNTRTETDAAPQGGNSAGRG